MADGRRVDDVRPALFVGYPPPPCEPVRQAPPATRATAGWPQPSLTTAVQSVRVAARTSQQLAGWAWAKKAPLCAAWRWAGAAPPEGRPSAAPGQVSAPGALLREAKATNVMFRLAVPSEDIDAHWRRFKSRCLAATPPAPKAPAAWEPDEELSAGWVQVPTPQRRPD